MILKFSFKKNYRRRFWKKRNLRETNIKDKYPEPWIPLHEQYCVYGQKGSHH